MPKRKILRGGFKESKEDFISKTQLKREVEKTKKIVKNPKVKKSKSKK
jgi:hypothetical protein